MTFPNRLGVMLEFFLPIDMFSVSALCTDTPLVGENLVWLVVIIRITDIVVGVPRPALFAFVAPEPQNEESCQTEEYDTR